MPTAETEHGYLAWPEPTGDPSSRVSPGPWPGVVLIPDVWGLGELYREFARRLAAEGFCALSIDLHGGPVEIPDMPRFLREMDDRAVLSRVEAGLAELAGHEACRGMPRGVVGFCIGGTYSLLAACSLDGIAAGVAFYGILSHEHGLLHDPEGLDPKRKPRSALDAIADLRCPLLGIFGMEDRFVPVDDGRELEARAERAGRPLEVCLYPGAGHAFLNEAREEAYRPEAARDAWERMLGFLSRSFRASGPG